MRNETKMHSSNEKGMALLLTMFLTLLAGLLLAPVLERTMFHHNNAFRDSRYLTALHLAEAGIEEAVWHLSYDKQRIWDTWETSNDEVYYKPTSVLYDCDGNRVGEYEVIVNNPIPLGTQINVGPIGSALPFPITSSSEPTITAVAGIPDLDSLASQVRQIQVLAKARTVFSLGLFSVDDLELGGTTVVNSYDSRLGVYDTATNAFTNGDCGTNGDILMFGTPLVDGDASAGGSVILKGDNAEITGEVEGGVTQIDLPPVNSLVEAAKLQNDNALIPQAVKSNGQLVDAYDPATGALNISAGATLNLPGGTKENPKVYYLSEAFMAGNSNLIIDDHVVVFTDGTLDFTGGTVLNNGGAGPPERFMIYSSGGIDTDIMLHGGAGLAAVAYAPEAQVTITGGGNFFGAAVGGKVDLDGNGQFHYDEALGEVGLIAYFEVNEWVEKAPPNNNAAAVAGM